MKSYVFLIFETGRRISLVGFAFFVLLAGVFTFLVTRFLAIRLDLIEAKTAIESAVESSSWPDMFWETLPVLPVILFAIMMAWGRYGSKTTYHDLSVSQQKLFQQLSAGPGAFAHKRLTSMLTIFGWLVLPLIGLVALFEIVSSIFGT